MNLSPLLAILGPTASGKSDLALYLASRLDGEIVNCDSIQVYRHFDIGAAKTPIEERRGIPHHLVDIVEPEAVFTAGDYMKRARGVLAEIAGRGRLPIVVGGTGFYYSALMYGLFEGPDRDPWLRERLLAREKKRAGALHNILRRLDAESAARIHRNDVNKTIRALEVRCLAGRPLSRMFLEGRDTLAGFRVISVGLNPPRDVLYSRIDQRLAKMFVDGLLDEVSAILASGVSPMAKPFESLGYKQALAVVRGELETDAAIRAAQLETRHYAKRQMTWFRREAGVAWFAGFGDCPEVQFEVFEFAQKSLELFQNGQ
ncbi:MAG TPA: tRNA (adenosine(37)-N6)-dimethylallyltransferase MiaA [Bryobacteraceae bacterium]|nr:tRNA (adenosine(37)-N6)-dimethylallyltransferase MiaA [Bryobacteraceae bacterium]